MTPCGAKQTFSKLVMSAKRRQYLKCQMRLSLCKANYRKSTYHRRIAIEPAARLS